MTRFERGTYEGASTWLLAPRMVLLQVFQNLLYEHGRNHVTQWASDLTEFNGWLKCPDRYPGDLEVVIVHEGLPFGSSEDNLLGRSGDSLQGAFCVRAALEQLGESPKLLFVEGTGRNPLSAPSREDLRRVLIDNGYDSIIPNSNMLLEDIRRAGIEAGRLLDIRRVELGLPPALVPVL